jgi:hypothetical protein
MESVGNDASRFAIGLDRPSLESSRINVLRDLRMAVHGLNIVDAVLFIKFGEGLWELDQFDDAWRCIGKAMTAVEAAKESWSEAEVHRIAGEVALMSPDADAAKAETCFKRALSTAREQQAKSWELRAAMSMARLWRDRSKRLEALDLLASVYGWFTEGFDTLDLKEAKGLLDELAS